MTLNEFIENEIKSGYVTNRYEFRQYVESVEILSGSSYQLVTSWHDEYLDYEVMQVNKHISYISDFMMDYELVLKKNTEEAEQEKQNFRNLNYQIRVRDEYKKGIERIYNYFNNEYETPYDVGRIMNDVTAICNETKEKAENMPFDDEETGFIG